MALVDDYVYRPGPPLAMPLTVLAGRDDDFDSPEQTTSWADETAGPCTTHWFDGDHFFINSARAAVLTRLRQALGVRECAPAAASARPPSDPASVPRPAASVP
jgi:surfactin synthase thioesterase subunit